MALKHSDFLLTDEQLDQINRYFVESSLRYAEAGEDPGCGASVTFQWGPGIGRAVTAFFDSASQGCEIE
jgi:hypothetical protein